MTDKRYYTVQEANAEVPRLMSVFARLLQVRGQLRDLHQKLTDAGIDVPMDEDEEFGDVPVELAREAALFTALAEVAHEHLDEVLETGCVIKDLEVGLVDWPAIHDGREIWLCWKYGEREVGFWHELDAGFVGRRPVSDLEH